jgi:bisphosphoglycerate-dependent phosphoglycerate mutase
MEPVMLNVDEWLLEFIKNHIFIRRDFYENKDDGVRLTLKLTLILAETLPFWADRIEPDIQQVKRILS